MKNKDINKYIPKRVVLHIGMTKAGSTYIQNSLDKNYDFLISKGVLFPRSILTRPNSRFPERTAGHVRLIGAIMNGEVDRFYDELQTERSRVNCLVLSAESLFLDIGQNGIRRLSRLLCGSNVEVVCFLRSQLDWVPSRYFESVTKGHKREVDTLEEFISRHIENGKFLYVDRLKLFQQLFPSASILAFDYDKVRLGAGILSKVLQIIGVEHDLPMQLSSNEGNLSTPFPEHIEAQRRLNSLHHPLTTDQYISWSNDFSIAAEHIRKNHDLKISHVDLSPSQKKRIIDACEESNRILSDEFLGGATFGAETGWSKDCDLKHIDQHVVSQLVMRGIELMAPHMATSGKQLRDSAKIKYTKNTLMTKLSDTENDRDALIEHCNRVERRYHAILSSTSWRATEPIRSVKRIIKRSHIGQSHTNNDVSSFPILLTTEDRHNMKTSGKRAPESQRESFKISIFDHLAGKIHHSKIKGFCLSILFRAYKKLFGGNSRVSQRSRLVQTYDQKLWGGFSQQALVDIERIKSDRLVTSNDRQDACFSLAVWHAVRGNFLVALEELQERRRLNPHLQAESNQVMLESLLLCRLRRPKEARRLVEKLAAAKSFNVSIELMLANCWNPVVTKSGETADESKVLQYVNSIYRQYGLPEIDKLDPEAGLSIDNLHGKNIEYHFDDDNKVSIIVPAFNAADTIETALRSLADQSWSNIEVLIVDDCSSDDTTELVSRFCASDDRFRLIEQKENSGSYACRNIALKEVTGKFVTTHDSDDWAHPSRVSIHVKKMLETRSLYSLSHWARVEDGLFFSGVWKPRKELTNMNSGSLMVANDVFEEIGGWDEVRISADREFLRRIENAYSIRNRNSVAGNCPLVLGRVSSGSLTQDPSTSVETSYHGVRRQYHEACDYVHGITSRWHSKEDFKPAVVIEAPKSIRSKKLDYAVDILFVGDWNMKGGTFHSAKNMILASRLMGLKQGLLHYPRYDLCTSAPLRSEVRRMVHDNDIDLIAPGEKATAKTVVVTYPVLFNYFMDKFPTIDHERLIVVVNQMSNRDIDGEDVAYDVSRVRENLIACFGTEGDWVPISKYVRSLMEADSNYPHPHEDTWIPLIDTDEWAGSPAVHWRGDIREIPIIGRHGRDHRLKWPGNRSDILAAYCADRRCEVRFLGGANRAKELIEDYPRNWEVHAFGSQDVKNFLRDLDFFVHYPHENYIEEFGRAPMEAMAIGVPVILPPVFKDTFADAALYANANEVWSIIEMLWTNRSAWEMRVQAGKRFVQKNCSYGSFAKRI